MRRNMKTFTLLAAAGAAVVLTASVSLAGGAADTPAPPAPTPAQRPAVDANAAADKSAPAEKAAADKAAPAAADKAGQSSAWSAEVATPGGAIVLNDAQTAIVKSVNGYFNTLNDLKGDFVQTTADSKRMRGKFMVKRPGRFRFDYARPSRQIIISDGEYLAIQDLDLNNEDRVSLDQTPFRLLLRKDVDLIRDAQIVEVQESEDLIVLALRDKSPDAPGKIKLFLSTKPQLELKEWVTTDAQGLDTRVEISSLNKGETLDAKLFKIEAVSLNNFHPMP